MLDGRGQVRLTDFGVAGLCRPDRRREIRSGTPAYMAPEQLSGLEVTARSDIYSLGLVLYESFAGRQPFHSDTIPGLLQERQKSAPASLDTLVHELDPASSAPFTAASNPIRRAVRSALAVAGGAARAAIAGRGPGRWRNRRRPKWWRGRGSAGLAPAGLWPCPGYPRLTSVQAVLATVRALSRSSAPLFRARSLAQSPGADRTLRLHRAPADTAWHFYWSGLPRSPAENVNPPRAGATFRPASHAALLFLLSQTNLP